MESSVKTGISLQNNASCKTVSYHVTAPKATHEDSIQKPHAPNGSRPFFLDLIPISNTIIDMWLFYHYKPFSTCRRVSHGPSHQNRHTGSPQVRSVLLGAKIFDGELQDRHPETIPPGLGNSI
jgi:hypothetical protein